MPPTIRAATEADVSAMVGLSEKERIQRETYEPQFFRKAAGSAQAQTAYFEWQLRQANVIAFVHDTDGGIDGFAIASLINAPPVYDPGGSTALIDDFTVERPEMWDSVGLALFERVSNEAKKKGAVGSVVICAHRDEIKRHFLDRLGMRIVSEWHTKRW